MEKYLKILTMTLLSILGFGVHAQNIKEANKLFKTGDFSKAEKIYSEILEKKPDHLKALIHMGYISLLSNRLEESETYLNRAKKIKPKLSVIDHFLAETYYRRKEFQKAAGSFRAEGKEAMAKKMESFVNIEPYKIDGDFDAINVKFVITNPLPIVEVTINETFKGNFFIDTGGGEIILDEAFANKAQVQKFGNEKSEFGGGKKAPLYHGRISSITLENLTIENIPIVILNFNQLELGGIKVDGTIGTVFLYQFLSTIDYKNGQLILRNKSKYNFENVLHESVSPKIVPFTMADDHFMLAKGSVNNSDSMLFFIDTGLAGNAFTCPKSTLKSAGLLYQKNTKQNATGGGGQFNIFPIDVDKICLGEICVEKLHGLYGPFPPSIENSFGFTIKGLISHEFFRNYALTIDFMEMKYILSE